jgi:TPR repeat protein
MNLTKPLMVLFAAASTFLGACAMLPQSEPTPAPMALDTGNPQSILNAANAGNQEAIRLLGAAYYEGTNGFEKDFAEAARWLPAAVEDGDTTAMAQMGFLYLNGQGVAADPTKALELITQSSKAGNPLGHYYLGLMHKQGVGVEPNASEGFRLVNLAAQAGNALAMKSLGDAYQNGEGTAAESTKALDWYHRAGTAGNPAGFFAAADLLEKGASGKEDTTQAAALYQQAAEMGHGKSMYRLSKLYRNGQGVKKNAAKEIEWLIKASEAEDPEAMREMAKRYARGKGVPKDPERATALNEKLRKMGEEEGEAITSSTNDASSSETADRAPKGASGDRRQSSRHRDAGGAESCASYYPGRVLRSSRVVGAQESIVIEVRTNDVVIGTPSGHITGTFPCR